jgi:hypothetical protein
MSVTVTITACCSLMFMVYRIYVTICRTCEGFRHDHGWSDGVDWAGLDGTESYSGGFYCDWDERWISAVIRKSEEKCGQFSWAVIHVSSSLPPDTVSFSQHSQDLLRAVYDVLSFSTGWLHSLLPQKQGLNNVWCMSRMWPARKTQRSRRERRKWSHK